MSKDVYGWLRMEPTVGAHSTLPTSQATYEANANLFDVIIPANGGELKVIGGVAVWEQDTDRTETTFAQGLKAQATTNGQLYTPGTADKAQGIKDVIDAGLENEAAAALVDLATTRSFDAPWDGVVHGIPDVGAGYLVAYEAFMGILSTAVKAAGLEFHTAYYGYTYNNAYFPFDTIVANSDLFHYYLYAWWPTPYGVSPYWWCRQCVEFALSEGVPADLMVLGTATYNTYYETDPGSTPRHDMNWDDAKALADSIPADVTWMETDPGTGKLVREWYVDTGPGHISMVDGQSLRYRANLVDEFGLAGLMLFTPGVGNDSIMKAVERWVVPPNVMPKRPRTARRVRGTNWREFIR